MSRLLVAYISYSYSYSYLYSYYTYITAMSMTFLEYSSGMNDALGCHCICIFRFFCWAECLSRSSFCYRTYSLETWDTVMIEMSHPIRHIVFSNWQCGQCDVSTGTTVRSSGLSRYNGTVEGTSRLIHTGTAEPHLSQHLIEWGAHSH